MIKTETRELNGVDYRYTYSDENRYVISEDGRQYETVYDRIDIIHSYTEGDIIPEEEPTDDDFAEVGKVLIGYEHN